MLEFCTINRSHLYRRFTDTHDATGSTTSHPLRRPEARTVALAGAAVAGACVRAAAAAAYDTAPVRPDPPRQGRSHPAPARAVSLAVTTRLRFWAAHIGSAGSRRSAPALAHTRVPHTRPDRSDRVSHTPCSATDPAHTGLPEIAGRAPGPGLPGDATVCGWGATLANISWLLSNFDTAGEVRSTHAWRSVHTEKLGLSGCKFP
jgi:hypothetical protein